MTTSLKFWHWTPRIICILAILFVTIIVLVCVGCNDEPVETLYDSWAKLYEATDTSFMVNLTFKEDGTFTWTMIEEVPNHTNSGGEFEATSTEFTLTVDPDCDGIGKYAYRIENEQLTIEMLEDDCEPRAPAFIGVWEKY